MEPMPDEKPVSLPSLFSFSNWKKGVTDPNMRRIELALFFGIGIFIGIALKSIAAQTFTIGYQDYTLPTMEKSIDLNRLEKDVIARGASPFGSNGGADNSCAQQ